MRNRNKDVVATTSRLACGITINVTVPQIELTWHADETSRVRELTWPADETSRVRELTWPADETSRVRELTWPADETSRVRELTSPADDTSRVRELTWPADDTSRVMLESSHGLLAPQEGATTVLPECSHGNTPRLAQAPVELHPQGGSHLRVLAWVLCRFDYRVNQTNIL